MTVAALSPKCRSVATLAAFKQAGKRLAEASAKGRVAAKSPEAAVSKASKMNSHWEAVANWNPAELPDWLDENCYFNRIQPALARVRKLDMAKALGISESVAYKIAHGTRIPHKRHWVKLAELVGGEL